MMKSKIKIATPVSHLFLNEEIAKTVDDLSDCLECRDRTAKNNNGNQILFHSDLQPVHLWGDQEFKYFSSIAKSKPKLEYVTFHIASCAKNPVVVDRMYASTSDCYSRDEMKINARFNFSMLRKIFGERIQFAVENNNYYPTTAYDHVTEASFLKEILVENNVKMLFDIAHSKVTAANLGVSYDHYIKDFPFNDVIQLHLSHSDEPGANGIMYDDHAEITGEDWDELPRFIELFPNLKFITIEYYKDENKLYQMIKKLRGILE